MTTVENLVVTGLGVVAEEDVVPGTVETELVDDRVHRHGPSRVVVVRERHHVPLLQPCHLHVPCCHCEFPSICPAIILIVNITIITSLFLLATYNLRSTDLSALNFITMPSLSPRATCFERPLVYHDAILHLLPST